ncbi:Protein of unknown function [Gryllus bimaculatus]|nr:Protein of unknown function [Gryllus bimaculatus]
MTVAAPQDQQMMDAAPQDQQGKDSAQQDHQVTDAAQQDKQETTTPYKFAFLTEIEWTGDPHDLDAANDALSEIVREALEGGTRGPTELIRPKKLDDLYFHEEKCQVTVTTEHAMAAARADWLVKQVDATVEQQHADFELVLPRILVGGRYSLDKKAHGDFTSREEGTFK